MKFAHQLQITYQIMSLAFNSAHVSQKVVHLMMSQELLNFHMEYFK